MRTTNMNQLTIDSYHRIPAMYASSSDQVDPQIIALCEDHERKTDRLANAHFIMRNFREGDAVLVETSEDQPFWNQQVEYLQQVVPLFGWEDENARKPIYELSYRVHSLLDKLQKLNDTISTSDIGKSDFFNQLEIILNRIPKEYHFNAVKILLSEESELTFECRKSIPYYILTMIEKFGNGDWLKIATSDSARNQSLIKTIKAVKEKYNRIFIIAGAAHLIGEEVFGEQVHKNIKIVEGYLTRNKFIVLQPKRDIGSSSIIEEELLKSKTYRNFTKWALRFISYGGYDLLNTPRYLLSSLYDWSSNSKPSHWHWHPNSVTERIAKIQSEELAKRESERSYFTLFSTFLTKYRFTIVDKF